MTDKDVIKMVVDNTEVEGVITLRNTNCFEVTITKPYVNISRGSCIPAIARQHYNFDGKYGDGRLLETLEDIFTLAKFIDLNYETLKEKIQILNADIKKLKSEMIDYKQFKVKRIELRKRLKKKEIDNKEYQKLLHPFKKESDQLSLEITLLIDTFIDSNFSMIVPMSTRQEVLDIINGKQSLRSLTPAN